MDFLLKFSGRIVPGMRKTRVSGWGDLDRNPSPDADYHNPCHWISGSATAAAAVSFC